MKHENITAFNVPDAWRKCVSAILHRGDVFVVKQGSECTETKKLSLTVVIEHPEHLPLVDDKCITTNAEKVGHYALEYLWSDSCHYDDGEEYTYGSRLRDGREYVKATKQFVGTKVDQIERIIEELVAEPLSRQLTMTIRIPQDVNSPHPPCLTMIDLDVEDNGVREDGLHMYTVHFRVYFRSWDAYAGFPENIAGLQVFFQALIVEANERSDSKIFSTGKMVLDSKNCHLYQRQYELALILEKEQQLKENFLFTKKE